MWQVPWAKALAAVGMGLFAAPALAQDYIIQQNQNGFDLPGVSMPQGQDEVRASDGTTCSASVAGTGAYLDVGVIRGGRSNSGNDLATYGRVVVPIGRKPKRLDCSKLYELEVERLRMELQLLKMGVADGATTASTTPNGEGQQAASDEPTKASVVEPRRKARKASAKKGWADEGWTNGG